MQRLGRRSGPRLGCGADFGQPLQDTKAIDPALCNLTSPATLIASSRRGQLPESGRDHRYIDEVAMRCSTLAGELADVDDCNFICDSDRGDQQDEHFVFWSRSAPMIHAAVPRGVSVVSFFSNSVRRDSHTGKRSSQFLLLLGGSIGAPLAEHGSSGSAWPTRTASAR